MKAVYRAAAVIVGAVVLAAPVLADDYVKGYVKKDGTYVAPHMRSSPNSTKADKLVDERQLQPVHRQRGDERSL